MIEWIRNLRKSLSLNKHPDAYLNFIIPLNFCLTIFIKFYDRIFDNNNFPLKDFTDRAIGIVVTQGIDANLRTEFYIKMVMFSACTFIAFYIIYWLIFSFGARHDKNNTQQDIKYLILLLAESIIAVNGVNLLARMPIYAFIVIMLSVFLVISTFVYIFNILNLHKLSVQKHLAPIPLGILIQSFFLPLLGLFVYWITFNKSFLLYSRNEWLYIITSCFYLCFYSFAKKYTERKSWNQNFETAMVGFTLPFFFVIAFVPIVKELQFSLSRAIQVSQISLARLGVIFLTGAGLALFFATLRSKGKVGKGSSFIKLILLPAVLFGFYLLTVQHDILEFNTFDLFHLGERMLPAHQLFLFHKIPLINIYPTHGISDFFAQLLYSLINGYHGLESLAWNGIEDAVGAVITFFFLVPITGPLLSFLVLLLLPISGFINPPYNLALFPTLFLYRAIKKPSFGRLLLFWVSIIAIILWKVDFGIAVFCSAFFVLLGLSVKNHKIKIKTIIGSFVLPFSVLAGVYLLLILISHQSFTTIMSQNIGFLKYQGPSISIPNLFIQYSTQVIFIYLIFPLIALIYCLFFLIKILDKQYRFTTGQYFLVFMAVFCLVISIRTIQRHTLSEGYNPLLFVPLLCLLPYYFRLERKFAEALFFTLYLCQFLILPTIKLAPLFYKGPYTQFSQSTNPQSRVKIMNDSQYSALVAFLENTLSKDQTFFDFTNAPMLYIFSNRMFPSYLIPNLSHTAETIQSEVIKTLTDLYNKNHVPVVIFKQGNSWDSVDNVPNEIRSYRIAEFIYKHYRPFGTIDNYQLWVDIRLSQQETENIAKANSNLKTSNVSVIQHFNVDKLPSVWANYDPLKAVQKTENQQVLLENDICKQGENLSLNLTPNIDKSTGNYLYLSLESEKVTEVQVILDDPDRSSVLFSVTPADELLDYIIRISSLWSWESQDVKTITLSCKDEIKINEIILKKGD